MIDIATNGQFKERYSHETGRFTLRQHVRRHTWFSPFFDWVLNFWMGQDIDTPITVWDEMFLPSEIGSRISEFEYIDSSGVSRPLVLEKEVVFQSQGRPAVLEFPNRQWPKELTLSLLLALFLGVLFYIQAKSPAGGQVALGITHSLLGLFFGGVGLVLFFMSFLPVMITPTIMPIYFLIIRCSLLRFLWVYVMPCRVTTTSVCVRSLRSGSSGCWLF